MTQDSSLPPWIPMLAVGNQRGAALLSSILAPRAPGHGIDKGGADSQSQDECRQLMLSTLESQIIPRLVQAHRTEAVGERQQPAVPITEADVADFASLCALGDRSAIEGFIERLRGQRLDQETIFMDLIGPAARHLGVQWEKDTLSFSDVTVGLMHMHTVIHEMGYEFHDGPQHRGQVRRVMFASAPGSQHVLGLSIVSELFRKAGWQVVLEVSASSAEICRAAGNEWFDLIGLSVSLDPQLAALPALVAGLRKASRNPSTPVLLGGPIFAIRPCEAAQFGAQAICLDARQSVDLALSLLPA
jgi:methanogenic corrinoid protein MtbC1